MRLHNNPVEFRELITITARNKHIPESAVERDYHIVRALMFLAQSRYADSCVFKGGTSLSKCYPGSIERFSEDIDLTFIPDEKMSDKQIERSLKAIEKLMTADFETEIIPEERNERNKSLFFWDGNRNSRIKLEIGSSVRPEPYGSKTVKTYIQEYLETHGFQNIISEYGLEPVIINVLNIERTLIDKILSVKRHAICGTIAEKARHIYDVTRLLQMQEVQSFLRKREELKRLVALTKRTDSVYLEKRNMPKSYNPAEAYDFPKWKAQFVRAKGVYEKLHEDLLYTDEKQQFDDAVKAFEWVNQILAEIGE